MNCHPINHPEIQDWTCAKCRKVQPARDKKYALCICRQCSHAMLRRFHDDVAEFNRPHPGVVASLVSRPEGGRL
jgi:hypothetical protein